MKKNKKVDWDYYFETCMYPSKTGWHRSNLLLYKRWYRSWLSYIDSFVPIFRPGITAFEFGSGIGAAASCLRDHGVRMTGSDVSRKAVVIARRLSPAIPFVVCNMEEVPKKTSGYDRVFAFEVLEHVSNADDAVKHIKKRLKKEGYFIGTSPPPYKKNLMDKTHVNVQYPEYWKKLFEKNGFHEVSTRPLSCLPFVWRIHPVFHRILPVYIPFPFFVSTSLIIARL